MCVCVCLTHNSGSTQIRQPLPLPTNMNTTQPAADSHQPLTHMCSVHVTQQLHKRTHGGSQDFPEAPDEKSIHCASAGHRWSRSSDACWETNSSPLSLLTTFNVSFSSSVFHSTLHYLLPFFLHLFSFSLMSCHLPASLMYSYMLPFFLPALHIPYLLFFSFLLLFLCSVSRSHF